MHAMSSPTRSGFRSQSYSHSRFQSVVGTPEKVFIFNFFAQGPRGAGTLRSTKRILARCRLPGPTLAAYDFLSRGNKSITRWRLHSLFLPVLLFYKYNPHFQGIWIRWLQLTILGRPCRFYFRGDVVICLCSWGRCGMCRGPLSLILQKKLDMSG